MEILYKLFLPTSILFINIIVLINHKKISQLEDRIKDLELNNIGKKE